MMDKWVFTPLGHFFHVVRPISFTAFRFYQNINNLAALFLMHHNPGAELFTPPSYCSLTAIGMELTAKEKLSVNKQKMPKNISFERIMEAITPELELRYYEEMLRFELVTDVVSLRATLQKDENLWKEAELSTENALHDFCCDILPLLPWRIHGNTFCPSLMTTASPWNTHQPLQACHQQNRRYDTGRSAFTYRRCMDTDTAFRQSWRLDH